MNFSDRSISEKTKTSCTALHVSLERCAPPHVKVSKNETLQRSASPSSRYLCLGDVLCCHNRISCCCFSWDLSLSWLVAGFVGDIKVLAISRSSLLKPFSLPIPSTHLIHHPQTREHQHLNTPAYPRPTEPLTNIVML